MLLLAVLMQASDPHYFLVQTDEFHLKWSPDDLTQQDVASLYSAQADSWTLVDEFSEFKRR